MDNYTTELADITHSVWEALFEDDRLVDQPLGQSDLDGLTFTSCVQITGAWEGAITFQCSSDLARRLTSSMFGMEPDEPGPEEVCDALGELANMIGGNVKALMPEPCQLSLPTVAEGAAYHLHVTGGTSTNTITFSCTGDETVVVRLITRQVPEAA
jgi:chemotaxis protein CheX